VGIAHAVEEAGCTIGGLAPTLRSDKFVSVIPANAGIHGSNNWKGILLPWNPDHVRDDQSTTSKALSSPLYALRSQSINNRPSTKKDSHV